MPELFNNLEVLETTSQPKKKDEHKEGEFKRQYVMFEDIRNAQLNCIHTIAQPNKEILTCTTCGALWLR
jgi:hypothetical protein